MFGMVAIVGVINGMFHDFLSVVSKVGVVDSDDLAVAEFDLHVAESDATD
mgnify:CR=1 FL=1